MAVTIGFVGYGNINSAVAQLAVTAGYKVVISNSRGPATLQDAVQTLGPLATAGTVEDVVRNSDLVSVSLPLVAYKQLSPDLFRGKIVMDSMNYYPMRDGVIEELESKQVTSSELVQRHLGARVVKVFNTVDSFHLASGARSVGSKERWALPVAADDADAKAQVTTFIETIGFDVADCGTLADSWRFQPNTPAYVSVYMGPLPDSDDRAVLLQALKTEHANTVTVQDILALAAKADRSVNVGGGMEGFPPQILKAFGYA